MIVDGIERDMSYLSPDEIETFTILKDASATAPYGIRGANGVIIVTTKRGRKGEKPTVDFKASVGVSEPIRYPDYLGSAGYATLYNEAMLNDNPSLDPGSASLFSQETISNFRRAKGDNSDGLGYNWDYFDYAFKPSILQDYSLSVRGAPTAPVISSSAATTTRAATTSIRTPTTSTSSCAITSAPTSMSTPPSG